MIDRPNSPEGRLAAFVARCLEQAPSKSDPAKFLWLNVEHVERQLRTLSDWVANPKGRPCPDDLDGLSAFDLTNASETLAAEAVRHERTNKVAS